MNATMNTPEDICWFHGKLTREEGEVLLLQDPRQIDGLFLVRESISSVGDFVLSVLYNNQVSHFQIRRHKEDAFFSIDECLKFHGLESLIEFYTVKQSLLDNLFLKDYIKGFPPPHDSRRNGRTNLLHRATKEGNYTVVAECLHSGYQHEAKDQLGRTPVHLASMTGDDTILLKLIEFGANVNIRDTYGLTPLHYACQNNLPTTVRLLVQTGNANIQARNTETGAVPLHVAASYGHKDVVKELLSLNAPVNPRTKENDVPSKLAEKNGFVECARILEKYKCPAPKTSRNEWYHGTLDRHEAETIIKQHGSQSGSYLIRLSGRHNLEVITLLHEDIFYHFMIQKQDGYLYIDDGPYLNSLEHIVEYYSFICDGLPTVLLFAIPPKPKPPVPEISTLSTLRKKKQLAAVRIPTKPPEGLIANFEAKDIFSNIRFKSDFNLSNNNNYVQNDNDFLPRDRLELGELIGEGEFGSVYEGTYLKGNGEEVKVAIKTLRDDQIPTNRDAFLREAQVMIKLNHHCIVKLIGLAEGRPNEAPVMMVQDLIPLGSMLQYILDSTRNQINPNYEFKIWAAQIASGMKYLEENSVVHRDLAARNILLASHLQAKISDFGLSRALGTDKDYYRAREGGVWPLKWYAPESFNFGHFCHKSDVWSFGITIWEMYSFGEPPYGDMKGAEAISLIENGERLEKPEECPDEIYEIMRKCWEYDSAKRPTFTELLDFFTSNSGYANLRELLPESNLV